MAMSDNACLLSFLETRLDAAAWQWLTDACEKLSTQASERDLFLSFSLAVRKCGKVALTLNDDELIKANQRCTDWSPLTWRTDHAARISLLFSYPHDDAETFCALLDRLFQAADLGEAEALYLSLPLLPFGEKHVARAQEGLRSNVKAVFEAVAHNSPFPRDHFADDAWNQMVLKALFIESQLNPIVGLEERCNPKLTRMLCDYAHERWAASREISIELWRCVGACADDDALADLKRVLETGQEHEQLAVALSVKDKQPQLLDAYPTLHEQLTQGLCWHDLLANVKA